MWQFSNGFSIDVNFIVPDSILHLFILIVSVILKQWFKISVAHIMGKTCRIEADRTRHTQYDVVVPNILQFWNISCGLVPSFSTTLEEALCVHLQKHTGCWGKHCRGHGCHGMPGFFTAFPTVLQSDILQQKTISSVSLQKVRFRSWGRLMDSVY